LHTIHKSRPLAGLVLLIVMLVTPRAAMAQLNGFNIKGDMGLKSGSQAPPGGYAALFLYRYGSDTIKDRSGNTFTSEGDLTIGAGATLFSVVTPKKILGANYGFAAAPLVFLNSAIESPRLDQNPSLGFGDIFIMPISLGWHLKRATASSCPPAAMRWTPMTTPDSACGATNGRLARPCI
jgi:hypothetical protein